MTTEPWRPGNNGAGKHIWFVCRKVSDHPKGMPYEYHEDKRGQLIRYKTRASAMKVAEQLNQQEVAV